MIFCVIVFDDNEDIQHAVIFDGEETMIDSEVVEEAAEQLEIEMPEMISTKVFRSSKADPGTTWLQIKDYEIVNSIEMNIEDVN